MSDKHPLCELLETARAIIREAPAAYDPDNPLPNYWKQFGGANPGGVYSRLDALAQSVITHIVNARQMEGLLSLGITRAELEQMMRLLRWHLGKASENTFPNSGLDSVERRQHLEFVRSRAGRDCNLAWQYADRLAPVLTVLEALPCPTLPVPSESPPQIERSTSAQPVRPIDGTLRLALALAYLAKHPDCCRMEDVVRGTGIPRASAYRMKEVKSILAERKATNRRAIPCGSKAEGRMEAEAL